LKSRISQLEQQTHKNNIEIKGIHFTKGLDPDVVLKKVADNIGEDSLDVMKDVEACHWVDLPNRADKGLIAHFVNRRQKDSFLKKAKAVRNMTNPKIGINSDSPIFINDHLSPENKRLFGMANRRRKENGWKFLWSRNGAIFAQKAEGAAVIKIVDEASIQQIN